MNIIDFDSKNEIWDLSLVGGKAFSLYKLQKLQLSVPKFICITTNVYSFFMSQNNALEKIKATISQSKDSNDFESLSNSILNYLRPLEFPEKFIGDLKSIYRRNKLDNKLLAVRSSSTSEDLHEASFAGQYDSFLNVSGLDSLFDSIKNCWLSLWTPRAISYRERNGIEHLGSKMAVVIQEMIKADFSGVLFTANPINNDFDESMLNAVSGKGEPLVLGKKTPQEWIYNLKSKEIEFNNFEENVEPILNTNHLNKLFQLGLELENYFGRPQDIEWSISNEKIYLLQSRSITTIDKQKDFQFDIENGYWTRKGLGEWLQTPMSPLFSSFVLPDFNFATDILLKQKLGIERPSPSWINLNGFYYLRGNIKFNLKLFKLPYCFMIWMKLTHIEWSNSFIPNFIKKINHKAEYNVYERDPNKIFEITQDIIKLTASCYAWIIFSGMFAKLSETLFKYLHNRFLSKNSNDYGVYLSGYPSKSIESNQFIWEIAEEIKTNKEIKELFEKCDSSTIIARLNKSERTKIWLEKINSWIKEYGHQVFELDIIHPTFQENPIELIEVLKKYINSTSPSPTSRLKNKTALRVEKTKQLKEDIKRRGIMSKILTLSLENAQNYAKIRESRPFYLHLGMSEIRKCIGVLSKILHENSVLDQTQDIFFLTANELTNCIKNNKKIPEKSIIEERKQERVVQLRITPPNHLGASLLAYFWKRINYRKITSKHQKGVEYKGHTGNKGFAVDSVCIILSSKDFYKFKKGNILVTKYTTPAWTPILSLASGVITETGGTLCHAAIIAREYDIPAVVGVPNIIEILRDGDMVEVNGNKGLIKKMKKI